MVPPLSNKKFVILKRRAKKSHIFVNHHQSNNDLQKYVSSMTFIQNTTMSIACFEPVVNSFFKFRIIFFENGKLGNKR